MLLYNSTNILLLIAFELAIIVQLASAMFNPNPPENEEIGMPLLAGSSSHEQQPQSTSSSSWLTRLASGTKSIGSDMSLYSNRSYQPINASVVLLRMVELVQLENAKAKRQPNDHSCMAEIVHKYYFRFNWKSEQCSWVKPDEHQFLSLRVQYEFPHQNSRKEWVFYNLWETSRLAINTNIVKHWLHGGLFLFDHNCIFGYRLISEQPKQQVRCLVKPGARCQNTALGQHERKNRVIQELSNVKLIQWENAEAMRVVQTCEAKIVEKHYFIFDWKRCKIEVKSTTKDVLVRMVLVDLPKNDDAYLSLVVLYKHEEQQQKDEQQYEKMKSPEMETSSSFEHHRYDLWKNPKQFPNPIMKRWRHGKGGQFLFDPNCGGEEQQLFFEEQHEVLCLAKPGLTCPYQSAMKNPFDLQRYPLITKPVVLHSVTLFQWKTEGRLALAVDSKQWEQEEVDEICRAKIGPSSTFIFDWSECKFRNGHEWQFLSLQVEYKHVEQQQQVTKAEATRTTSSSNNIVVNNNNNKNAPEAAAAGTLLKYRYDLWDRTLFEPDFVSRWKQGQGHYRIDHNMYPERMFIRIGNTLKDANGNIAEGGMCQAKPTIYT